MVQGFQTINGVEKYDYNSLENLPELDRFVSTEPQQLTDEEKAQGRENLGIIGSGKDGFSPSINAQQTDAGAIISITDKDGTTTVQILNGEKGDSDQFKAYGLGTADNPLLIPSDYALASIKDNGWYSVELAYGTIDFGDGFTANKFLLRVESGASEQYTSVTKQTAIFASYPGAEEYFRYCKNGYDWTAWQKANNYSKTLLWSNSSPYSSFPGQNISINNYDKYGGFEIIFSESPVPNLAIYSTGYLPKPDVSGSWTSGGGSVDYILSAFSASSYIQNWRTMQVANGALIFTGGLSLLSGREVEDDNVIIPLLIYGIKGAQE